MPDPSLQPQHHTCKSCGITKPLSEFSNASGKGRAEFRPYPNCKPCKAQLQRERRAKVPPPVQRGPKRVLEPKNPNTVTTLELAKSLTSRAQTQLDFGLWDQLYGRRLADSERVEIQTNLTAFITIFAEERNRQTGDWIELSKNK